MKQACTILITGAGGGIGQALALRYAGAGCTLVLHGRSDAALREIAGRCQALGATCVLLVHDLEDHAGWMDKLATCDAATPVDLAFINAGVASVSTQAMESWEDTQRMLDVNLRAAMATAFVLARAMQTRRDGHIVLVSSLAGYTGMALTPAYSATKAGLRTYGEALRGRLAPHGVRVTVVLPGFVRSAMSDRFPATKPQLVSAAWAARKIHAALPRNPARVSFPRPLSWGMWWLSVLPVDWTQAILRRLGFGPARGDLH